MKLPPMSSSSFSAEFHEKKGNAPSLGRRVAPMTPKRQTVFSEEETGYWSFARKPNPAKFPQISTAGEIRRNHKGRPKIQDVAPLSSNDRDETRSRIASPVPVKSEKQLIRSKNVLDLPTVPLLEVVDWETGKPANADARRAKNAATNIDASEMPDSVHKTMSVSKYQSGSFVKFNKAACVVADDNGPIRTPQMATEDEGPASGFSARLLMPENTALGKSGLHARSVHVIDPDERYSIDQAVNRQLSSSNDSNGLEVPIERAISIDGGGRCSRYSLSDFAMKKPLGQGGFAKVYLVRRLTDNKLFALKSMRKGHLVKMQQVEHVRNEKLLMHSIRNPFIVGLEASFQDARHVYLIMEYMSRGDLFNSIIRDGRLKESLAQTYAAEVAMALSYLHSKTIIYRDLKPENVLLDDHGHVKLGDFGFAKAVGNDLTNTFCGTPSYIAPEILLNIGYTTAVDWWSFGVLVFEMLSGCSPFQAETTSKTYSRILQGGIQWPRNRGQVFSPAAEDLITSLLEFSPCKRLGCIDEGEIWDHKFFKSVSWGNIKNRTHNQANEHNGSLTVNKKPDKGDLDTGMNFEHSVWSSESALLQGDSPSTIFRSSLFKDF